MKEKIICEKCGFEMHSIRDLYTSGVKCPNCSWSLVTTYIEPIVRDSRKYCIILKSTDVSISRVKTISEIANCNYIEARRLIMSSRAKIFNGNAVEVKSVKERLENENIAYSIEPDFPY